MVGMGARKIDQVLPSFDLGKIHGCEQERLKDTQK